MSKLNVRRLVGGLFTLAVVMAPVGVGFSSSPAGAAPVTHAVRPSLAVSPRTFPPSAVTFNVNTTTDTHDATLANPGCADATNQCSLRAALEEANASGKATSINLQATNYPLTLGELEATDPAGVQIVGAGAGVTSITAEPTDSVIDVTQGAAGLGAFVGLTNLDVKGATTTNDGGAISVDDGNDTLELSNATVSGAVGHDGGGIYNDGQLWATNSLFSADSATDEGGAIYNENGSARLTGDTFSTNSAVSQAGAIDNDNGPVSIDSSDFTANSVTNNGDASGGALFADDETELTNDTFTNNTATTTGANDADGADGGAIYDEYGLNNVTGSTFSGNEATNAATQTSEGGAFYDESGVTITQSTFTGNTAQNGEGGGISEEGNGLYLNADTLSGNAATGSAGGDNGYGGGLYGDDSTNVTDTTVTGNHADVGGGGMVTHDGAILTNSTVSKNTSNLGAGIYGGQILQATSDAIVDNTASGTNNAGGGLFLEAGGGANHLDLQADTISGNVSDTGAGIALQGGTNISDGGTLSNDIVAANRTSGGAEQDCGYAGTTPNAPDHLTSAGGNVVGDATCGFGTSTDRQGAAAQGYWEVASDGGIFSYNAGFFGSMGGKPLNKPIVGMAHTPGNQGYWEVASDGGIFTFGDAGFFGSMGGKPLNAPVVGMAASPDGQGYIEVASDGGVFTFGDAGFYGSMGGKPLNKPIVGIAITPDGRGYWEVASDGGIFAFGDAGFFGSMGGKTLNKPIVGIAPSTDGLGYFEVASDGGIFNFGTAGFFGSTGAIHLNAPVVGVAASPDNLGYSEFASDGGVFNWGSSLFHGSAGGIHLNKPVVGGAGT